MGVRLNDPCSSRTAVVYGMAKNTPNGQDKNPKGKQHCTQWLSWLVEEPTGEPSLLRELAHVYIIAAKKGKQER